MNIDTLMFENYLDQLILEDTALIYESGMNGKIKLVAKITLAISATALLILVAKKIKKYVENNKDKKEVESVINLLNSIKLKLFKLKGEAKKVEKVNENEKTINNKDIYKTMTQLSSMGLKAAYDFDDDKRRVKNEKEVRKIESDYKYISGELNKAHDRVFDLLQENPNISKEDSEWLTSTMKDVENYMRGRK